MALGFGITAFQALQEQHRTGPEARQQTNWTIYTLLMLRSNRPEASPIDCQIIRSTAVLTRRKCHRSSVARCRLLLAPSFQPWAPRSHGYIFGSLAVELFAATEKAANPGARMADVEVLRHEHCSSSEKNSHTQRQPRTCSHTLRTLDLSADDHTPVGRRVAGLTPPSLPSRAEHTS